MSKYALFAGPHYYPSGGWDDFRGVFPDIESAKAAYWWLAGDICEGHGSAAWGHIVWLDSMAVVHVLPDARLPRGRFPVVEVKGPVKPERRRNEKASTKMLAEAFDAILKPLDTPPAK